MLAMRRSVEVPGVRIVAVDNAPAMIAECRRYLAEDDSATPVDLVCADVRDLRVRDASVVVLNFTLQFIPPAERTALLHGIAEGLLPGGILILSEKIAFGDEAVQALFTDMHHGFKRSQGYSELEIAQKRSALEQVLVPETLQQHRQRLLAAGFRTVENWFQCFNFASLVAFK
jgi:tRNA (cmo5U34)-methyltransferase